MNQTLTFILLSAITSLSLTGQVTFFQYFDGADTSGLNSIFIERDTASSNIWQIGPPQKTIFDTAATFPNAIITDTVDPYPANNTSTFSFGVSPAPFGFGILALQWMQKLDMDHGQDGGIIEFSIDTGKTWQSAFYNPYVYNFYGHDFNNQDTLASGEIAFTGTDSTWRNIWLCYDISWLSIGDTLQVRFTFKSDSVDNQREGWMIDNFLMHRTFIHTVNEFESGKYISIYPNPTTGKVNIEAQKIEGFHIIEKMELLNMKGEIVQDFGISPVKFSIDIGHHPAGTYLLKVQTNQNAEAYRIILKDE